MFMEHVLPLRYQTAIAASQLIRGKYFFLKSTKTQREQRQKNENNKAGNSRVAINRAQMYLSVDAIIYSVTVIMVNLIWCAHETAI